MRTSRFDSNAVAKGQHAGAQLVFSQAVRIIEVAEFGEGIGEARNRRFRDARALGHVRVRQIDFAGTKATEHFQPARQRVDELAVLAFLVIAEDDQFRICRGLNIGHICIHFQAPWKSVCLAKLCVSTVL